MHVALFTDFPLDTLGGIQTSTAAHRRALERLGHRVTVVTVAASTDRPSDDPDVVALAPWCGLGINGVGAVLPTARTERALDAALTDREPIDVIHTHTAYGVAAAGIRAARRHAIPVVQTMHSRDDAFLAANSRVPYVSAHLLRALHRAFLPSPRPRPRRLSDSRAAHVAWSAMFAQAAAADAVVVPSEHFARRFVERGLDPAPTVVSNGVPDDVPVPDGAARARRDGLRVVWCGRVSPEKRPLTVVEAVRATPDCTLDVYGDGPRLAAVRAAASGSDRVRVHGGVDQRACLDAMREADVVAVASVGFDTQGMAVLEATAVGTPVVYCDPDLAESVPDGAGILTRDPSAAAFAETLAALVRSPGRVDELRAAAVAAAPSTRQSERTSRLLTVYERVIEDARVRGRTASDVPPAPGRRPGVGHALRVLRDGPGFVRPLADAGPILRVDLGPRSAYLLTTPDLIRAVGFRTAGRFHRDDLAEAVSDVVRGASNVLCGDAHDLRRRLVAPALRRGRLDDYAATTTRVCEARSAALAPRRGTVDLVDEAHGWILDALSSTLFRADFGARAAREIRADVPWLLGEVILRTALPAPVRRARIVANRRFVSRSAALRREIGAVVGRYRAEDRDHRDVASALVRHVDPETGARLADDEIVDELILMLAAGVGSTASILAWVWYEIARDDTIAARVHAEVDAVVGDGPVRPGHLRELGYLRTVVLETLRMWGPWISAQNADGPVTFDLPGRGTTTLPDGAMVVYSPYLVHHDRRRFPDPGTFDPGRFAESATGGDRAAYLPFGVGERHCPGNHFATDTIIAATAALFGRWTVTLGHGRRVRPSATDFVAAPSAVRVRLTPRR